jgi:hypothetical protein
MIGVTASQETLDGFTQFKLKHKEAWIIYRIDGSSIVVDSSTDKSAVPAEYLPDFIEAMKAPGEPRYAVVDWNHKILFVSWVSDNASGRLKMMYASAKEGFIQALDGISDKLQATDEGELTVENIVQKTSSNV